MSCNVLQRQGVPPFVIRPFINRLSSCFNIALEASKIVSLTDSHSNSMLVIMSISEIPSFTLDTYSCLTEASFNFQLKIDFSFFASYELWKFYAEIWRP